MDDSPNLRLQEYHHRKAIANKPKEERRQRPRLRLNIIIAILLYAGTIAFLIGMVLNAKKANACGELPPPDQTIHQIRTAL